MSEYASEEIVIPTHVDWLNPMKDLIGKILAQDCENLNLDALCQEQGRAIERLLALVVSLDRYIEWIDNKAESPLNLELFRYAETSARDSLYEIGIDLPGLYLGSASLRSK